ncbi:MAG TPA: hypothetical protein VN703_00495 [Candidatus Sulfopaludibacter sp.]|nr:hypothetical protein [Candidatus Sulfopaludibacter sp.]
MKTLKKFIFWWVDNLRRPSTWAGLMLLFLGYLIYNDKIVLHKLLEEIISDYDFIKVLLGLISGALIIHKKD